MYYFVLLVIATYLVIRIHQVAKEGKEIKPSALDVLFEKIENKLKKVFKGNQG